jgi:hypothetical protein
MAAGVDLAVDLVVQRDRVLDVIGEGFRLAAALEEGRRLLAEPLATA